MKRMILVGVLAVAAAMVGGSVGQVRTAQAAGGVYCNDRLCNAVGFRCSTTVTTGKKCLVMWTLVNGVLTRTGCSSSGC